MPLTKKKKVQRSVRKRKSEIVVVIATEMAAEDTLFPEKVARAKEVLSKAKCEDPRFRSWQSE
jgi:hypothetical protein